MREFEVAAGRSAVPNPVAISFKLGGREMTAKAPTAAQLALFVSSGRGGGLRSVQGLLSFFGDVVDDRDWRRIEELLHDGMDIDVLSEIANYLIEEWSGRPTLPSSGSSSPPNGTGRSSTESSPPEEEGTPSTSLSTAS